MDFKELNEELQKFLEISQSTVDKTGFKRRENRTDARDNFINGKGSKEKYQQAINKLDNHNKLVQRRKDRMANNATWVVYIVPEREYDNTENISYTLANMDYIETKITDENLIKLTLLASDNEDILSIEDAVEFWKNQDRFVCIGDGDSLTRFGIDKDLMEYSYRDQCVYVDVTNSSQNQKEKGLMDKAHAEEVQEQFRQMLSTAKVDESSVKKGKFRGYATFSSNGETKGTYNLIFKNTGLNADFFINESKNLLNVANEWIKDMPTPKGSIYSTVKADITGGELINLLCDAKITKTKIVLMDIPFTDTFIGD